MRLLMVDDDKNVRIPVREFLKVIFEKKKGIPIEIVEVGDGQAALEALAMSKFDVIMLDSLMPVMTGDEFLAKYDGDVPIIFSSAYHTKEVGGKIKALAEKPYDCFELAETILRLADPGVCERTG